MTLNKEDLMIGDWVGTECSEAGKCHFHQYRFPTSYCWNLHRSSELCQCHWFQGLCNRFLHKYADHVNFCGSHSAVLFHVCLVYHPGGEYLYQVGILPVCILHGGAFPDADVYTGSNLRSTEAEYPLEYLGDLSGIWCRSCRVHVFRFHEVNSSGNWGSGYDRWL